ncbi:MAG: 3-phosphoserine/phosphohydroxythreonine transaminase [Abditibacteriota bacterium]|nr:3-phosphoserine/phosphohydroxythreonine transaminase [Abditibacteriota bacterium]
MAFRAHNFNAGPAALPLPVLEIAQKELCDFKGSGMSVIEMSHRGKEFDDVNNETNAKVRDLMGISDDYEVLFMPGGASMQFCLIPMNFIREGKSADFINTGSWATKAIKEAKVQKDINVIWDDKEENYIRCPKASEIKVNPDAEYVHICENETIGGIKYFELPECGDVPIIADMSSCIMSEVMDVNKYGMIYAGAQKNIGPSGLALCIIRKDLLERVPENICNFFKYTTHAKNASMYNTPNTWAIYILGLVCDYLKSLGGVPAMEKINREKAKILYDVIDSSDFWRCPVDKASRSIMNVVWRLPSEDLEKKFVAEAKAHNMIGLKGHRSVGGLRASIYNAVPKASVEFLAEFMKEFEKVNG